METESSYDAIVTLGCFWEDMDKANVTDMMISHHQNITSAAECQNLCKKEPTCAYFTVRQKGHSSYGCYLNRDSIGYYHSYGAITGPKHCNGE